MLAALAGCGPPSITGNPEDSAELAQLRAEQKGAPHLAEADFARLKVLGERYPGSPELRPLLIKEFSVRQDFHSLAVLLLEIPAGKREREHELLLIDTLVRLGRHDDAYARVLPLLERTPTDPELLWLAGYIAFQRDDFAAAKQHFDPHREALLGPDTSTSCPCGP